MGIAWLIVGYTGKLESDNPNQLVQVPVVHGYFGSAGGTFKDRYGGHKHNLEHRESKHTSLSAKYWELLDHGLNPKVSWEISIDILHYYRDEL